MIRVSNAGLARPVAESIVLVLAYLMMANDTGIAVRVMKNHFCSSEERVRDWELRVKGEGRGGFGGSHPEVLLDGLRVRVTAAAVEASEAGLRSLYASTFD